MSVARHRLLVVASVGLALAGCRNKYTAKDPYDGAIHLPTIGQTEPYGQTEDIEPTVSAADTRVEQMAGAHAGDLKVLRKVLAERWANRQRHQELDGVDVPSTIEDLAEAAGKAKTKTQFAVALRNATCRLSDGHLRIHKGPPGDRWWTSGLRVRPASGEFVVAGFDPDHWSAAQRKPKLGDIIEKVDGTPMGVYVDSNCLTPGSTPAQRELSAARALGGQHRFADEKPAPTKLTVRRAKGKRYTIKLDWRVKGADEGGPCVEGRMIGKKAGLLSIHTFACRRPDGSDGDALFRRQLDDAVSTIRSAKSLVVDLRHNPGGSDAQAKAAARLLVGGSPDWMRFRHIEDRTAGFSTEVLEGGDGVTFEAPMSVLIGPGCASTCEIFASVLATRPNTTLIGQATAGSVGNPEPVELPRSGIIVWVPKTQYALPGTDALIEGRGVMPQVEVMTTSQDIRRKRDPALENALSR